MTKKKEVIELPPIKTVENPVHRLVETVFLPAFLEDNPILEEKDPFYRETLYAQGEKLANALLDGDWSVFAGQLLSEFAYHRHVCKPFDIPRKWTRFRGYDYGFAAPCCMLWLAKEPSTGRLFVYNELYKEGLVDRHQAEMINDMCQEFEFFAFTFGGHDAWTKRTTGDVARSTYDVFLDHQIYMTKADTDNDRKTRRVRSALAEIHDGEPGIKIFSTCENLILEIEGLMSDPNRPERPLPNQQDHAYDALAYALTNYSPPTVNFKKKVYTDNNKSPYLEMEGI